MRLLLLTMLIFTLSGGLLMVGGCANKAEQASQLKNIEVNTQAEGTIAQQAQPQTVKRVKLIFAGGEAIVELYNNPTSRDFQSLLPMTLQFEDFNHTEKIAYPPRTLFIENTPPKFEPSIGELTVFVPWGNLAIFYRDFHYSSDLVAVGRVTTGIESLAKMEGTFSVRIEAIFERSI